MSAKKIEKNERLRCLNIKYYVLAQYPVILVCDFEGSVKSVTTTTGLGLLESDETDSKMRNEKRPHIETWLVFCENCKHINHPTWIGGVNHA